MQQNGQQKNSYVRSRILTALLEMMASQPFETVSVSRLAERAGVGRASFYRNYTGREDVLRQEAVRLAACWQREYERRPGSPVDMLASLLDFFRANAAFYGALYRAGLSDIILDTLLRQLDLSPELPNVEAYVRSSVAYLLYGWIIEWIKRGMQESGAELAGMIAEAQRAAAGGTEFNR